MSYYNLPFSHELVEESFHLSGDLIIRHKCCEINLSSQHLGDEIIQHSFKGSFSVPTQLETVDTRECNLVTFMLNLGGAVYYHIHGLKKPRILPNKSLSIFFSSERTGHCRYQHQTCDIFMLQVPKKLLLEYLGIMNLGCCTKKKLKLNESFIVIKPASDSFVKLAINITQRKVEQTSYIQCHLAHAFVCDAIRYLAEDGSCKKNTYYDLCEGLENAVRILDKDFALPPTITQLAKKIGTNETSLKSWFRKELNTTIHQYTLQRRMSKARQLLQETQQSIAYIAQEVGYSNHGHFAVAFKKEFGYSPSSYKHINA